MDDWQDIEDDDYPTVVTPPSSSLCKDLHREPSLNDLLRLEQQQLTNRVTQYQMVAEDPVHEVLAMTQNIASLVGQISKNIPDLVNDAMLASAEDTALPAVTRHTFLSLTYLLNSFQDLSCTS